MATFTFEEFAKKAGGTPKDAKVVGMESQLLEPTTPEQAIQPNFFQRVKSDIQNRGDKISSMISGEGEYADQSAVRRGTQAVATAFSAVPNVAKEALPEIARTGLDKAGEVIGKGFTAIADKIGDSKRFQEWVTNNPDAAKGLEEILGTTAASGEIAGNILATGGGAKIAQKGADVTKNALTKVNEVVSRNARLKTNPNIQQKITDFLSGDVDKRTATILNETPTTKFDEYVKIADEASIDPRKITPFERVGDNLSEATKKLSATKNEIGKQKSAYMEGLRFGFDPFDTKPFVQKLNSLKNGLNNKADKSFVQGIIEKAENAKTKRSVDSLIDDVQEQLYKGNRDLTIPQGSSVDKQLRGAVSTLNKELKASLPKEYGDLNAKFSEISKIVHSLNRSLGEVVDGVPVRGANLVKQFFSPSGRKAKELFEYIKKETGVDLAQDATLAKFTMELFDDPRARALLEGIPTSPAGFFQQSVDILVEKTGAGKKLQNSLKESEIRKARVRTKN